MLWKWTWQMDVITLHKKNTSNQTRYHTQEECVKLVTIHKKNASNWLPYTRRMRQTGYHTQEECVILVTIHKKNASNWLPYTRRIRQSNPLLLQRKDHNCYQRPINSVIVPSSYKHYIFKWLRRFHYWFLHSSAIFPKIYYIFEPQ